MVPRKQDDMSYATLEFYFLSEILPKPILSIEPSSVVPTRSNVTLSCVNFVQNIICSIQMGGNNLDPRTPWNLRKRPSKLHSSWGVPGWFNFYLTGLEESDAGYYTCVCSGQKDPDVPLQNSDAVLLLVTGHLPKPSLQAHQWSNVTAGGNVILQCKKPDNMTEYKMFLLLKEGVSAPVQVQRSERNRADFSLHDVTPEDTGKYSCVYHQIGASFWASYPSDLLEILVSDTTDMHTPTHTGTKVCIYSLHETKKQLQQMSKMMNRWVVIGVTDRSMGGGVSPGVGMAPQQLHQQKAPSSAADDS
ncbi:T-cell-interacting, activating receptor on myeloid cells protein 1-like [Arvicola amphibius]|uniref:T-cell-interacting, activating receptor on myeloid cells protein 1-like n=1 Tax=Arvicola amphibius TaxID=1047088 RepID=UPI001C0874B9|nr:T-cell-interacting, activating receptor on myeloid cells protein 1-like [Arvicola amphibius]